MESKEEGKDQQSILSETSKPPLDILMATIYTQYSKINYTELLKISFSLIESNVLN